MAKKARVEKEREREEKESEEKKLYYISYSIISLSLSDSFHTTPFQLLFDYAPPSQKDPREREKKNNNKDMRGIQRLSKNEDETAADFWW